jgi:O-antigen/teichoic acid export membrane protein
MNWAQGRLGKWIRGTAIVLAGNGASAVLGFAAFVLLARNLSPASFGTLAPMISILDISQIFMDMVIGGSTLAFASRYVKSDAARADMAFKIAFWARAALAGVLLVCGWLLAPWLSTLLFDDTAWTFQLRLAFIGVTGVAVYTSCISVLQARQLFLRLAGVIMYKNIFRLAGIALVLYIGVLSIESAVWVLVLSILVAALMCLATDSPAYLKRKGFDRSVARELLETNKWMLVLVLILVAGARLDVFMLTSLSTTVEVGHYAAAFQLCSVVAILGQTLITTLFPEVASFTEHDQIRRYVLRYLRLVPLLLVPIVFFVVISPMLVQTVLGKQYAEASSVFSVLLVVGFVTMLSNPLLMALFPLGMVRFLALANALQVAARVVFNMIFLPAYGALGAAAVDLTTKLIMVALVLAYILRRVGHGTTVVAPVQEAPL